MYGIDDVHLVCQFYEPPKIGLWPIGRPWTNSLGNTEFQATPKLGVNQKGHPPLQEAALLTQAYHDALY